MKPFKPKLPQGYRRQKDAPNIFLLIEPPKPRVKYVNPPLRYCAAIMLGIYSPSQLPARSWAEMLILTLALESRARKRTVKLGTVQQSIKTAVYLRHSNAR